MPYTLCPKQPRSRHFKRVTFVLEAPPSLWQYVHLLPQSKMPPSQHRRFPRPRRTCLVLDRCVVTDQTIQHRAHLCTWGASMEDFGIRVQYLGFRVLLGCRV